MTGASIRFVLVEPQSAGNIGASARALKNCGFDRLLLVAPACDPLDEQARRFAVDARDVLVGAERVASLDAALAGAATVIGTSALAGKQRRPNWRLDAFAAAIPREAAKGPLAFVFGRESRGLTDDELDRCTHLVHLAAAEAYTSFNLAQAVLLCAYTARLALDAAPAPAAHDEPAALHEEREAMYAHLNEALRAIGFLKPDQEEGMERRLRRMFGRADFTSGDVKVLRGIARQILWIARR
ncbi:MAG TPA: RNA methyltransferase [Candidatus Polarisedimenticolaceae bacterium]